VFLELFVLLNRFSSVLSVYFGKKQMKKKTIEKKKEIEKNIQFKKKKEKKRD